MKKINTVLASSAAATLLMLAPFLASAHEGSIAANAAAKVGVHEGAGRGGDNDGDMDDGIKSMHATVGVVTAINGSGFTISPVGHKATTTVSTDIATTFRVNGQATSSSALQVGSHVALIGTSTSSTSFAASMVSIFTEGFGFFKHFFRFGAH